jgi:osmotically-inducible protein OsmY
MSKKMEDRALAKSARHALARTILDVAELEVNANDGYIELSGKVRTPRGHMGTINFKKEMESLKAHIRQTRGVKDVYDNRVIFVE